MNNPTRLQRLEALRLSIVELINEGIDLPDTLAAIEREIANEQATSQKPTNELTH